MFEKTQDEKGRYFKSLRLSVVPHCNFACTYCTEAEVSQKPSKLLSPSDFIALISKINPLLDLYSVRITGGEPTLYAPLPELISQIKRFGIPKVHLTSNGILLPKLMPKLVKSGLDSINVSIDALDPDVFFTISRRQELKRTLEGIQAAVDSGLPVKLNCTLMKGINDTEILPLLEFAKSIGVTIRFLELMEMGPLYSKNHRDYFLPMNDILTKISSQYTIDPIKRTRSSTARYWTTDQGHRFGIIANYSMPFCSDCNRLRLDHAGKIYGCLSNSFGSSITGCNSDEEIKTTLRHELSKKQDLQFQGSSLSMKAIGG